MHQTLGQAMTGLTKVMAPVVLDVYDFAPYATIVDVGGSEGGFLTAILADQPDATGILFDLPDVIDNAHNRLADTGLASRCELVAGNFFDHVPSGGDIYLLKWVLHNWNDDQDDQSITILKNCRNAMADDATLLIVDAITPPGNKPSLSRFLDLRMMVLCGGQERTTEQFEAILTAAGFRLTRVLPMRSTTSSSIVEAAPARD